MSSQTHLRKPILSVFAALAFLSAACRVPGQLFDQPDLTATYDAIASEVAARSTETPAPPEVEDLGVNIIHLATPVEPPAEQISSLVDPDTSPLSSERRAAWGDNYALSLYERPFNTGLMDQYYPQVDIIHAYLNRNTDWVFTTIKLKGPHPGTNLDGTYGVELDLARQGRGHFLILASAPGPAWSVDSVEVWQDVNQDVGGVSPLQSGAPGGGGNGYELKVFDQGIGADPDMAWARIKPGDSESVQIAFKPSLVNNQGEFLWGVWSWKERGLVRPELFDYNDQFTFADSGSPLIEDGQFYPIKGLASMDNSCRWVVGFQPVGDEVGLCPLQDSPVIIPTNTPQPVNTLAIPSTPTQTEPAALPSPTNTQGVLVLPTFIPTKFIIIPLPTRTPTFSIFIPLIPTRTPTPLFILPKFP